MLRFAMSHRRSRLKGGSAGASLSHRFAAPARFFAALGMLALLVLAGAAGCEKFVSGEGSQEEAGEKEKPVTVRAEPAQRRTIVQAAYGLGQCEALPERRATISSAVEGRVSAIRVRQGEAVKAGQPIVDLDRTIARAGLDAKIADRQTLEASLRLLRALPRPEERKSLQLAIDQAKAGVEKAESTVRRLRPLRDRKEISPEQMVQAELSLRQAQLQQETAQTQLNIALLGPRPQAVEETEAKIVAADAAVASAKAQLDLHTIRAPIDGVLNSLSCHLGQTVAVGAPVGEMVDSRQVFVVVGLAVAEACRVRVGQEARVASPDSRGADGAASPAGSQPLLGKVTMVGRVADPQTGNLPVRILADNAEARLVVGQIAAATLVLRENRDRLAVPAEAIHDLGEGPVLSVIRGGKTMVLHPKLGVRDRQWVEVLDTDLKAGEPVVTEGGYNLPDKTEVSVEAGASP